VEGALGWRRVEGVLGWRRVEGVLGWRRVEGVLGWRRVEGMCLGTRAGLGVSGEGGGGCMDVRVYGCEGVWM